MTTLSESPIGLLVGPAAAPSSAPSGWLRINFMLLIALITLVGLGKSIQADTMDPDAFWHLRVADQLVHDGIGPLVDRISFASEKAPWTPYSWLAELAMRAIWNGGGFAAGQIITGLCSAAIISLIALSASQNLNRRAANPVGVALLVAGAAFFTLPFISFRPVTFVLVIVAGAALLMRRDAQRPTPAVWWAVPLTWLATNLHLYAALIAVMAVLYALAALANNRPHFRRRLLLSIACSAAACGTPMLRGAIATALHYNNADPMVASPFITEMRPFYSGAIGKVSLILVIAALLLLVRRRDQLTMLDKLWTALGVILLVRLGRFSPVFAILATPALASVLPNLGARALSRRPIGLTMAAVLGLGLINVAAALPMGQSLDAWLNRNSATYPTAAAQFVDNHVTAQSGHLLNEFNWGGYLAWRLNQQQGDRWQILMDGRTQLYAPAFWNATHLGTPATRLALLKTITADAAVLPADGSCLAEPLAKLGWTEAYRDSLAIVMVPPPPL